MNPDPATIDSAERIGRLRARLLPIAGTLLIIGNAMTVGTDIGIGGRIAWLALFAGCFVLVVTGGVVLGRLRALTDDESGRAHRLAAVFVGYCAAVACAAGLFLATAFVAMSAREAVQIVLATALAAPMISFGALERRALG